MARLEFDLALIYKQLEHLEKEIQVIKTELAQIAPVSESAQDRVPELEANWDALQEAKGLWEREWDEEWKSVWEKH